MMGGSQNAKKKLDKNLVNEIEIRSLGTIYSIKIGHKLIIKKFKTYIDSAHVGSFVQGILRKSNFSHEMSLPRHSQAGLGQAFDAKTGILERNEITIMQRLCFRIQDKVIFIPFKTGFSLVKY